LYELRAKAEDNQPTRNQSKVYNIKVDHSTPTVGDCGGPNVPYYDHHHHVVQSDEIVADLRLLVLLCCIGFIILIIRIIILEG
jgi:hypothetical protein